MYEIISQIRNFCIVTEVQVLGYLTGCAYTVFLYTYASVKSGETTFVFCLKPVLPTSDPILKTVAQP